MTKTILSAIIIALCSFIYQMHAYNGALVEQLTFQLEESNYRQVQLYEANKANKFKFCTCDRMGWGNAKSEECDNKYGK